ncbi:hypothetical protein OG394_16295 [Kribbella sp. NBC_01245]|uniref:hypothetical protein n=1 Tax=Kribbella sp. NBC_01245 TaxID=2903578 RepID=UPI002E2CDCBD|nr:hypothetical protein [Kribbella sp. NBC_01245]
MRRIRIGYAFALTAGLAGPLALVACSSGDSSGVQAPSQTTVTPSSRPDASPSATPTTTPPATTNTPTGKPSTPGKQPETGPEPGYDRSAFSRPTMFTNKWFPLRPGTRLNYRGQTIEDGEAIPHTVTFIVTDLTKVIDGVRNVVLWERDYREGVLEEAELAFFAQADGGDVWHFGQYPEVYEGGQLTEVPAWIHGVEGARAGITIKAKPQLGGRSYSQGWGPAVGWSDRAEVFKTNQKTCVKAGCFQGVLVTDETSADEPGAHQLKYYAAGIGNVRVGFYGNDPTKETLELVSVQRLSKAGLAEARAAALSLEKRAYRYSKDVYGRTAPMK